MFLAATNYATIITESRIDFLPCIMACEMNVQGYAPSVSLCRSLQGSRYVGLRSIRDSPPILIPFMTNIESLKAARTVRDLAVLLDLKIALLTYVLYKKPREELYTNFTIPKRHGGVRNISSPCIPLKLIQSRLSSLLLECWSEICEIHGHVEDSEHQGISHGFKRFHTIMTNGRPHVTRRFVFNVDLSDFFGCINFGRVRAFFTNNKNFLLHPDVATALAQIACSNNQLPQGSPCSPVISNFLAHGMDLQLVRLARKNGVTYSRYADDLTFSTNESNFPDPIACLVDGQNWTPGNDLLSIVKRSGFSFNEVKTRMQYKDSKQEVTGLTVNRKINVPAAYRNTVRSMAHALFRTGTFSYIYKKKTDTGDAQVVNQVIGTKQQLFGMLSFIDQVEQYNIIQREKFGQPPTENPGRQRLFRRFIYYDKFYSAARPILICEGKTDNVYLRCAIKSLANEFPLLATVGPDPKLNVDFFKYTDRRITDITELNGGFGGLCKFIRHYYDDIYTKFRFGPAPSHPVIIFIDNDSGAPNIYGVIAELTKKKKPAGLGPFIHVAGNLYVVPTPFDGGGNQTDIEFFFKEETLSKILDGRSFNKKIKDNSEKFYNKATFSIKVVAKESKDINFENFRPLLARIELVLNDYAAKIK